jgi:hypothetical protein
LYQHQPQPCFSCQQKKWFLQDTKHNFSFLLDSGALLSIIPLAATAPPTGPHLVGATGKTIQTWGFCGNTVCFSGQSFEFDFY